MIRFAEAGDHPRIKTLWAEAFGDPRAAIDLYFASRHKDEHMLVDERGGDIAGMLSLLPLTLCTGDGRTIPARYIYAVATALPYRRQGISTALLEAAHTYMQSRGEAAGVLVPASPGLFDFYAGRGYAPAFYLNIETLQADNLPPFPPGGKLTACSASDYVSIRNLAFRGSRLFARWTESHVSYCMQTLAQTGGTAVLSWAGGCGCVAWEKADHGVLVRELALTQGDAQTAIAVLHKTLCAVQYTVRLAQRAAVADAAAQPFGMVRWLIPQPSLTGTPPYLSLAMD